MKICWIVLLALLTGCASDYRGISVRNGELPALGDNTFSVVAENMPAFLGPIVVSNFSVALAERGLQPVSEDADAHILIRFEQDDIGQEGKHDDFSERIDQGGERRFVARLVVEMTNGTGEKVQLGSLQRIHTIRPGDYMHTGRASIALLEAFRDMLAEFPARSQTLE